MRRPARFVLATLLPLAALAACGGDDSSTASASSSTTAAAAKEGATSSSANLGSGGGPFCDKARASLKDVLSANNPVVTQLLAGLADPTKAAAGKTQAREYFEKLRKDNEALVKEAPDEIKETMRTALDGTQAIFQALDDVDYDFSKLDVTKLTALTTDPKFSEASKKLQTYFKDKCGFDLGSLGG